MKKINYLIYGLLIIAVIGIGYVLWPNNQSVGAVVQGATYSNAPIVEQTIANTSSIFPFAQLNTDSNLRIIDNFSSYLVNATNNDSNTSYAIQCATSSVPNPSGLGNTNYVVNIPSTVSNYGTTTYPGMIIVSSSTPGIIANPGPLATTTRIWDANAYLVCSTTPQLFTGIGGFIRFGITRQ